MSITYSKPEFGILSGITSKAVVYGLGASTNAAVGVILLPVVVKCLLPVEYGRFALAEMLANLLVVVLGLGLYVSLLSRFPLLNPGDRTSLVRKIVGLVILSCITFSGLFLGVAKLVGATAFPSLHFSHHVLITLIASTEAVLVLVLTVFRAEGRAFRYVFAVLAQLGICLGCSAAFVLRGGLADLGLLYGRLLGDIAALIILGPTLRQYAPRIDIHASIRLLPESLPLVPATIAAMWITLSPRFFLEHTRGTSDVGLYALASKVAGVVSVVLVQPFALAWQPALFEIRRRHDAPVVYGRVISVFILVALPIALGIALVSPLALSLVGRTDFTIDGRVVAFLGASNVLAGLVQAVNIGPYVTGQTSRQVSCFVGTAIICIPVCYFCCSRWGIAGAGGALLALSIFEVGWLHWMSQRLYPIKVAYRSTGIGVAIIVGLYVWIPMLMGGQRTPATSALHGLVFAVAAASVTTAVLWKQRTPSCSETPEQPPSPR